MTGIVAYDREDAGAPPSLVPDYRSTVLRSPRQPLIAIPPTLTETTGPDQWDRLMVGPQGLDLTAQHKGVPQGQRIIVSGRVLDDRGRAVPNTVLEIWQANAAGRYASVDDARDDAPLDPHFVGFGRASVDADGVYRFRTIRPGRVPGPGNTLQAPHLAVSVFGRGILKRLATRLYFDGGDGNDVDPVLCAVPEARRHTLIARQQADGRWWFDIHLQGDRETVFFAL